MKKLIIIGIFIFILVSVVSAYTIVTSYSLSFSDAVTDYCGDEVTYNDEYYPVYSELLGQEAGYHRYYSYCRNVLHLHSETKDENYFDSNVNTWLDSLQITVPQ